jgi:hypothetical protein
MPDFTLTSPGPDIDAVRQAETLRSQLMKLAAQRRMRRPTLVAWSFRMENQLHHDLQAAAKALEPMSMTEIVHGLIDIMLPVLMLGREAKAPVLDLAAMPEDQRQQLADALSSLSAMLQKR